MEWLLECLKSEGITDFDEDFSFIWEETTFSHDIYDEPYKTIVKKNLTSIARYILKENPLNCYSTTLENILIPLLIRLGREKCKEEIKNPEKFYNFCLSYIRDHIEHYEKINKIRHIDIDAQICHDLEVILIKILKNANATL